MAFVGPTPSGWSCHSARRATPPADVRVLVASLTVALVVIAAAALAVCFLP